jgi:hypothetical protein
MASELTPAEVEKAIQALTVAEKTNLGIEVTLPVAFGDGELVSVVIEPAKDGFSIHDAGLSAMRLTTAGVALTKHVAFRLNEFSRRYQCKFVDGRITINAAPSDVALKACLVANAARAVADYVYEIRRQAEYDFRVVLYDRLRDIVGPRARETEEIKGESGTRYRIPIILDPLLTQPRNFVSPVANHSIVARSVAMFFDIKPLYPGVERDAVYDNEADIRKEDRILLKSVGTEVFSISEASLHFRQIAGKRPIPLA